MQLETTYPVSADKTTSSNLSSAQQHWATNIRAQNEAAQPLHSLALTGE